MGLESNTQTPGGGRCPAAAGTLRLSGKVRRNWGVELGQASLPSTEALLPARQGTKTAKVGDEDKASTQIVPDVFTAIWS